MSNGKVKGIYEPLYKAPPEIQRIVKKIHKIEKDRLYQQKPMYIIEEITNIIKGEII